LPPRAVAEIEPAEVGVRVAGPRHRLLLLDRDQLALGVDLSTAEPGTRELRLSIDDVRAPQGLRVLELEPAAVQLSLERP
jgi:hypothetical protein